MKQPIELDLSGPIATLTLNRPEKRNALTHEMLIQLEEAGRALRDAIEVRAVIVRAEGEHFCVGMDLDTLAEHEGESLLALHRSAELGGRMMRALQEIPQPTICALQGVVTGGGSCIATACDFRVAAMNTRFGYAEVKRGMNLMWNSLPAIVALLGQSRAKQLVMSGEFFPADTLLDWGLFDELCELEELPERALAWAEQYAALPPMALQMIKRSINYVSGAMDASVMHADVDQNMLTTRSEDFAEAIDAFMEKRPGHFRGN